MIVSPVVTSVVKVAGWPLLASRTLLPGRGRGWGNRGGREGQTEVNILSMSSYIHFICELYCMYNIYWLILFWSICKLLIVFCCVCFIFWCGDHEMCKRILKSGNTFGVNLSCSRSLGQTTVTTLSMWQLRPLGLVYFTVGKKNLFTAEISIS